MDDAYLKDSVRNESLEPMFADTIDCNFVDTRGKQWAIVFAREEDGPISQSRLSSLPFLSNRDESPHKQQLEWHLATCS